MELGITLNKMIYSIKEEFNQYSDDNLLSDEYLAYQIEVLREDLISRTYNNPVKDIPDSLYTKLCMDIERHPDECHSDMNVYRTKDKLPGYFLFNTRNFIKGFTLGSIMLKYINYTSLERIPYLSAGKYSSSQLYYSIDSDGRLLIISSGREIVAEAISIKIIVRKFEESLKYNCDNCDKESPEECLDLFDMEYPIDGTIHTIILQTIRQQIYSKFNIEEDKINDGSSNSKAPNYAADNYRKAVNNDRKNQEEG